MKPGGLYAFAFMLLICLSGSCSDNQDDEVATPSFVVDVASSGISAGSGLSVQIGIAGQDQCLASATIGEDGKAVLQVDMDAYVGRSVWVCLPRVVKYFHVLTQDEAVGGKLTLPDKDKGSTLLTDAGSPQVEGKYYVNDWIVAYYMGVNKGGNSDVPIYWASGNLIATKLNAANSGESEVAFHIASMEEAQAETVDDGTFLGMDSRLQGGVPDAYSALEAGTCWDLFGFGDNTGKMLYEDSELEQYIVDTGQSEQGGIVYEITGDEACDIARARLGGSWRTPSGGKGEDNELAAFEDTEFPNLAPDAAEWLIDGVRRGYKYEYRVELDGREVTVNTLYFPAAGYRHAASFAGGRGMSGWYWSSTADPTGTTPYVPNGVYAGEVNEKTTAFNFGFLQGNIKWYPHPRTSVQAIRPVTD